MPSFTYSTTTTELDIFPTDIIILYANQLGACCKSNPPAIMEIWPTSGQNVLEAPKT